MQSQPLVFVVPAQGQVQRDVATTVPGGAAGRRSGRGDPRFSAVEAAAARWQDAPARYPRYLPSARRSLAPRITPRAGPRGGGAA